ncbi:MAG TPA: hypothetical protein VNH64_05130 [Parvularculaceae bacterium]|nr:hypothetical protein [Parvularculaceae bacterium]
MRHGTRAALIAAAFATASCGSVHIPKLRAPSLHVLKSKPAPAFSFVVIGDTPYSAPDAEFLNDKIVPAIRSGAYPFVIHVGDDKPGGAPCTGAFDDDQAALIAAIKPKPVFYTPGDNEWTDCDRNPDPATGQPTSELHRLQELRARFFSGDIDAPGGMHAKRQAAEPENQTWVYHGVRFATLEVVGTNNGRNEVLGDPVDAAAKAADARDANNVIWLNQVVKSAIKEKAMALVIAMQADMTQVGAAARGELCTGASDDRTPTCDGYAKIVHALIAASLSYGRPILLIHGDTPPFLFSRYNWGVANLWRLNAAGDVEIDDNGVEQGVRDATLVTVTPGAVEPFAAKALVSGAAPAAD